MDDRGERAPGRAPFLAYVMAAQLIAAGLGVVGSSFVREALPFLRRDSDPLLAAGVVLFFLGAAYFLVSLVSLFVLEGRPRPGEERYYVDGINVKLDFGLGDPATHVALSVLELLIAFVLLTVAVA